MRIVISGTVGVGKTQVSKKLKKELTKKGFVVNYLDEQTISSPYLNNFYKNPEDWAFISQLDFVLERFKQWLIDEKKRSELIKKGKKVITIYDRHFLDDYIFAELHALKRNISSSNSIVYQVIYNELIDKLIIDKSQPDYLFLLSASLDTVLSRLKKRNRKEEQGVDLEYWQELYDSYYIKPKFKYHFKKNVNQIININTENLTVEQVVEKIINKIKFKWK